MNYRRIIDFNRRSRAPALPPRARWAARLVVAVPCITFLIATLVYFVSLGHLLRANLAPVVAGEATKQLNHQVLLGSLDFQPGALILNNVVVSNRRTFAGSGGEAALSTRRVTVHYRLHDLLFDSGNAGHAFGDIVIEQPTVLVERLTAKRFNFSDVIDLLTKKPRKPNSKPFAGRIIVTDATVHARDYMAPANLGTRPANNTLVNGSVTVDFASQNNVYFVGRGRGADGRVTDVAVSGDASRKYAGRFRVSVQVADGDAAYWSSYFAQASPVLKKATVVRGRADLDMIIARLGSKPPPGLPVDLEGRVNVRQATIALHDPQFVHLPVQNVSGTAIFTGAGVTVDGSGLAGGQFVRFNGTVFDFTKPQLAFEASSPRLDAVRLARYFPQLTLTPGLGVSPAPVTARITGTSVTPVVSIQTVVPAITLRGFTATDVRARALYVNQILNVPSATFRLNGSGQGVVRVTVNTGTKVPTVFVGGRVTGLDVATLRQPTGQRLPVSLGGSADVAFLSTGPSPSQSVTANVTVHNPRIAHTLLRAARARVAFSPAQMLTISRAVLETQNGGFATVSGTVDTLGARPVRLTVHAAGADMARLLAPYSKIGVGGLAYAQAAITGPLATPHVAGQVQLFGASYGRLSTDVITGAVTGDQDSLHLQDVVVSRFPTQVRLSGTVGDLKSQNPQLSLRGDLSQGDLTDVLALANQLAPPNTATAKKSVLRAASALPALTGTIEGDFQISGRVKSPRIAGSALVTDATVDAYRIRQLSADVAYADDTVRVDHANLLTEEGTTATAHGQYGLKSGKIGAVFAGQNIVLDQFDNLIQPYADVDGVLDVSGRVGGTINSPTAAATVVAHSLAVEGQTLAPFTIAAKYADGVVTKTGDPWVFTFQTPGANNAQYIIDALRVSLPTPTHPKMPPALTLAARLPETAPENLEHLQDALRTSRFSRSGAGQRLLAQLNNLPATPEGTVWVPSLVVAGPLTTPVVQATVAGRDLALDDNKIGSLAARVSYTGGTNPTLHAEASAADAQAAGVPVQSLVAQGDYANRVVTVTRLDARSEQAYLHGSGRADLDGAIRADLDASNVPLSLANLFLPPDRRVSGTASALTVQASGQTQAPDLTASINLDSPAVTVTTPALKADGKATQTQYAVDSIRSGTITLTSPRPGATGKVLAVTDLAVFKGGRRLATLSGTLPVAFGASAGVLPNVPTDQPLHAVLQVTDLSVLSLFSPDVIDPKRTGGALTATVDYGGGTGATPQLLGQVMLSGGSLGIQGFDTSVTGLNGTVSVENDHLVAAVTGQSSKGGTLNLSGGGTLDLSGGGKGQADLRLGAKNVRVDETGRGNYLAKTYNTGVKGMINGGVTIAGPWQAPLIATQPNAPIIVSDATGTLPSAAADTGAAKVVPPVDPHFNVAVLLGAPGKTVSVRSSLLQAEANGDVELGGRMSAPELRAHLTVAHGQFILPPATRLVIVRQEDGTSNTVDMRYPVISPDPADNGAPTVETRVHLIAQANVTPSAASLAANQSVVGGVTGQAPPQATSIFNQSFGSFGTNRYTITARIDGLLNVPDRLTLDLSSNPSGLSHAQMLASLVPEGALQSLLSGQGAETAVKQQIAASVTGVLAPTLLSPLEQGIQTALGLEDFSVDYSPDAPVNVTLTKQIAPRLLVTYIRAVGARQSGAVNSVTLPPEYQLKLGYGLTRHLQVSVSTDDQKNNTLALEGVFSF